MKQRSVERLASPGFSTTGPLKEQGPTETHWTTPSRKNLPKPIKGLLTFTGLMTIFVTALFSAPHLYQWWNADSFIALGLLTIGIGALILAVWCLPHYPMYQRKVAFRPDAVLGTDEYLVVLRIIVNGRLTGIDEGLLGMDGNLLFFTGEGCSFALGGQDFGPVRQVYPEPGSHVGAQDISMFTVLHPNRKVWLEVTVIETAMVKVSLIDRFNLFQGKVRATGPRSYPPLERPRLPLVRRK